MPYSDRNQQRTHQRERLAARRREWLQANGPCAHCGSWEDLEVDHVDPAIKVDHRVWSWSQTRRDAELAKCQALCQPCHREKTSAWRTLTPVPHGTDAGYTKRKCHCDECTEAHRIAKQEWRDSRKARGLPYT